jgi:hypothetical protein
MVDYHCDPEMVGRDGRTRLYYYCLTPADVMEAPKKLKSSRNRNEYLTKPINKETLFQAIKSLNLTTSA